VALTVAQRERLDAALRDAYRSYAALGRMMSLGVGRNLDDYVAPAGLRNVVVQLIDSADAEGWVGELVAGAMLQNPRNPTLRSLLDEGVISLHPVARRLLEDPDDGVASELTPQARLLGELSRQELQAILQKAVGFLDPVPWAAELLATASRICRIEVVGGDQASFGTGFLVGADRVLTNDHVLRPLIDGTTDPGGVRFRFDYRIERDGTVNHGIECGLAPGDPRAWLLASSPASAADLQANPAVIASPNELDFALVRLDTAAGRQQVPGGTTRGWFDLDHPAPRLEPGLPILILQHPASVPVKLATDTRGLVEVNANATRVTYRANTLRGSSGSPCFTLDFVPIALHHAGEPNFGVGRNEGVPLVRIVAALRDQGVAVREDEPWP
jgi:hypothetical protein